MTASAPVQTDPEGKVDENSIPKHRVDVMIAKATAPLEAAVAAAEARATTLEAERQRDVATRSQAPATPPPATPDRPAPTREEMRHAVDEQTITQDQMDAELTRQSEQRVLEQAASAQEVKSRGDKLNTEVDQYLALVPDLNDVTSDNNRRFNAECAELHKRGFVNDVSTQLVALRNVLGDVGKIKIPEIGHEDREVDTTTHGGGGGGEEESKQAPEGAGPLKGLGQDHIDYYTKGIEDGRYSGWDDPHLVKIQKREVARK